MKLYSIKFERYLMLITNRNRVNILTVWLIFAYSADFVQSLTKSNRNWMVKHSYKTDFSCFDSLVPWDSIGKEITSAWKLAIFKDSFTMSKLYVDLPLAEKTLSLVQF